MTTARDVIEYMAAGMYGKNWNSDDPEKRPGERMKDVWREYARDALGGALSAPDSVRQELAALLNPWREIETAPKDGSEIDLWCKAPIWAKAGRVADCWYSAGKWWRYAEGSQPDCREEVHNATHWLPLPARPSEDKT